MNNNKRIFAIDLFCGIGGLTKGLELAGINVIKGYDFDKSVKQTYEKNNNASFELRDVSTITSFEIKKIFKGKKYTLIAGCAPCQPFSSYQKNKSKKARKSHYKYPAFEHFIRLVKEVNPTYVTMENVRGILNDDNFKHFVNDLKSFKYFVDYKVVNIRNYGAPQNRKRMFLIASQEGNLSLPSKTTNKIKTIKQSIGSLPKIRAGQINKSDSLHRASNLSKLNIKRIRKSRPGGTWKDWPYELLPNCYRKASGKTFSSVYGRLNPNKPANTLTTQFTRYGTGRYGHYEQDRALSLREGAIIQTFPKNYWFNQEKLGITKVAMHIGNAVPPIAGNVIGKTFMGSIK